MNTLSMQELFVRMEDTSGATWLDPRGESLMRALRT